MGNLAIDSPRVPDSGAQSPCAQVGRGVAHAPKGKPAVFDGVRIPDGFEAKPTRDHGVMLSRKDGAAFASPSGGRYTRVLLTPQRGGAAFTYEATAKGGGSFFSELSAYEISEYLRHLP